MGMGTIAQRAGRTFLSGALAVTLALPTVGALGVQEADAAAGFPDWDVQAGAWYVPYIEWAFENGIVSGYDDGTFGPDDNVTRGQVAVMMARAAGVDLSDQTNTTPFRDNPDGQYYTAAVNWAYEYGILAGSNGLVRPNDNITRQEMAVMGARFANKVLWLGYAGGGDRWPLGTTNYESVADYAHDSFVWMANSGVMGGIALPDGTNDLAPEATATRAQFAKIMYSLINEAPNNVQPRDDSKDARIGQVGIGDRYNAGTFVNVWCTDTKNRSIVDFEVSIDGGSTWRDDVAFDHLDNLTPGTTYTALVRIAGIPESVVSQQFTTAPTVSKREMPAHLEVARMSQTGLTIRAYDSNWNDKSGSYEFSLDGVNYDYGYWDDGAQSFYGLTPGNTYTVYVRNKRYLNWEASDPATITVTLPQAPSNTDQAERVWVNEYKWEYYLVDTDTVVDDMSTPYGNGATYVSTDYTGGFIEETRNAYLEYYNSLTDMNAPYSERWEKEDVSYRNDRYHLVKTGGHWEYIRNEEERQALYSSNESAWAFGTDTNRSFLDASLRTIVSQIEYTTSDGQTFTNRADAWRHCEQTGAYIASYDGPHETYYNEEDYTQNIDDLIAEAGGTPGEAWCLTGDTLVSRG